MSFKLFLSRSLPPFWGWCALWCAGAAFPSTWNNLMKFLTVGVWLKDLSKNKDLEGDWNNVAVECLRRRRLAQCWQINSQDFRSAHVRHGFNRRPSIFIVFRMFYKLLVKSLVERRTLDVRVTTSSSSQNPKCAPILDDALQHWTPFFAWSRFVSLKSHTHSRAYEWSMWNRLWQCLLMLHRLPA